MYHPELDTVRRRHMYVSRSIVSLSALTLALVGAGCSSSAPRDTGPRVGRPSSLAPAITVCGRPFFSTEANPQVVVVHPGDHVTTGLLKASSSGVQFPPFLVVVVSQDCSHGAEVTVTTPKTLTVLSTAKASDGLTLEVALAGGAEPGTGKLVVGPSAAPTAVVEVPVARSS